MRHWFNRFYFQCNKLNPPLILYRLPENKKCRTAIQNVYHGGFNISVTQQSGAGMDAPNIPHYCPPPNLFSTHTLTAYLNYFV
ncbi:hypothetical protein [Stenoxybacter acetivorans]|uniref:hypothetical protein n=1 Tax=Stenoxybacter acetivorans TaxID=422441 RepID=UPI00056ACE32|nr:hypothetical protein [Stenoxybacter acetivorans]